MIDGVDWVHGTTFPFSRAFTAVPQQIVVPYSHRMLSYVIFKRIVALQVSLLRLLWHDHCSLLST